MRLIISVFLLSFYSLFAQESASVPEGQFGYPLNTQNAEYCPVIAPNARYIVFQSNRPGGVGGMDLWLSENLNFQNRSAGKPVWNEPVNFRELNTTDFEGPFTILFDKYGNPIEIYFTSKRNDGTGRLGLAGLNIYYTKNLSRQNPGTDKWSVPEHLLKINSNFEDKMPAISPDGKTLVFSSNRPGGYGGFDLWVSNRDSLENSWSEPVNLGAKINTPANEISPSYHYDGMTIFFSSDRKDPNYKFHIYMADLEDDSLLMAEGELEEKFPEEQKKALPLLPRIRTIKKLSSPINSADDDECISLTQDGLWVYYSSNRKGGEGQFDIYRTRVTDELRKPYAFDLSGIVVDGSEDIMIGLDSTLKFYSDKGLVKIATSRRIGGDVTSPAEKEPVNFKTRLLTGSSYRVLVSAPGYHPNEFTLDLKGAVGFRKSKYIKIILMPIKEEATEPAPEPPAKETGEPEKQEKNLSKLIILKDFLTKKNIDGGKVTIFQEKERNGVLLLPGKDGFVLNEEPVADYEILGSAKGYQSEAIMVNKENSIYREKKIIEIFLRKLGDFPAIYSKPIYFEFNEYVLKPAQKLELDKIAEFLKANQLDIIEVGGHTDNIATKEYNVKLSTMRADVIKSYLVQKGIDANRIQAKAYWYSMPAEDNSTEEGRAKNRRATFKKLN